MIGCFTITLEIIIFILSYNNYVKIFNNPNDQNEINNSK